MRRRPEASSLSTLLLLAIIVPALAADAAPCLAVAGTAPRSLCVASAGDAAAGSVQQRRQRPAPKRKAPPPLTEEQQEAVEKNAQGVELAQQGKMEEALALFVEAARMYPELPEAHYNRGVAHRAMGQDAAAAASLRSVIRLRPGHAEAHYQLGELLFGQARATEAAAEYAAAVEANPEFAAAWLSLGNARAALQELRPSIDAYRHASELAPQNSEGHFRLAVALYGGEEYAEAWEHVHMAQDLGLEVNPAFLEALREQLPEPERHQKE